MQQTVYSVGMIGGRFNYFRPQSIGIYISKDGAKEAILEHIKLHYAHQEDELIWHEYKTGSITCKIPGYIYYATLKTVNP